MKNITKSISLLLLLVGLSTSALAQEGKIDPRLEAKFTSEQLQEMQKEKPDHLDFWTYYLDNGYSIQEMPKGKGADLPEVSIADPANFNLLTLKIEPQKVGNKYFRIKETGKLLAVHSWTDVKKNWAESKK